MSGEVSAAVAARIIELKTPMTSGVLAYLLVLLVCYLLFLLSVSIWSWRQNRGKEVNVGTYMRIYHRHPSQHTWSAS
jgi:uncharacterized protein (DUF58 family)